MTGIGCMMAAGGPYGGGGTESFYAVWNDGDPYNMSSASGQTNGVNSTSGNVIVATFVNGSGNYTCIFTITSNPSGKLSLTNASAIAKGVGWSSFLVNETESITVRVDGTDNVTGFSASDTVTVRVKRNS